MSKTIISTVVIVLVAVLPYFGVTVGSEDLTTTIQTILTLVSGIVIWVERVRRGDVNVAGVRL